MILDLGCGLNKQPEAIGVDNVLLEGVDIVHDLNIFPYPFKSNSMDEIYLNDVLEHLDDIIKVMGECHRILKSGGILHVRVVHWSHRYSYSDPQHKHYFSEIIWEFFTGKRRVYYTNFFFKDLRLEYIFDNKAKKKYGENEIKLLEKAYFHQNIIQGMKITLVK
jgi:predicted SAM-dependent methyltransferase